MGQISHIAEFHHGVPTLARGPRYLRRYGKVGGLNFSDFRQKRPDLADKGAALPPKPRTVGPWLLGG